MRRLLVLLMIGGVTALHCNMPKLRAQPAFSPGLEISSVADFYAPLSAYGTWVDIPTYGRCWRPGGVSPSWRPYTDGTWEWTDAGWYWASDEPWAWACYHYGTWIYDANYGWVWVPGTEWAPAWVAWREGPDFIGWAPCTFGEVIVAPSLFVFVDIHHFHHRIHPGDLVTNDRSLFEKTRFINNLKRETRPFNGIAQRVVIDPGPSLDPIQQATGTRFTPRPIGEVAAQTSVPQSIRRARPAEAPPAPTGREQPRMFPNQPQRVPQPSELPTPRPGREIPVPRSVPTPAPAQNPPGPPPREMVPPRQQRPPPVQPPAKPEGAQTSVQGDKISGQYIYELATNTIGNAALFGP